MTTPPKVEAEKFPAVQMEADRYVSYQDANIRFPALVFTFPTVPNYHPDLGTRWNHTKVFFNQFYHIYRVYIPSNT